MVPGTGSGLASGSANLIIINRDNGDRWWTRDSIRGVRVRREQELRGCGTGDQRGERTTKLNQGHHHRDTGTDAIGKASTNHRGVGTLLNDSGASEETDTGTPDTGKLADFGGVGQGLVTHSRRLITTKGGLNSRCHGGNGGFGQGATLDRAFATEAEIELMTHGESKEKGTSEKDEAQDSRGPNCGKSGNKGRTKDASNNTIDAMRHGAHRRRVSALSKT